MAGSFRIAIFRSNRILRCADDLNSLSMPVFVYAVDGDSALAASLLRAQQRSNNWPAACS